MSVDSIENIKKMGYKIVDLTCPDVRKVQDKAIYLAKIGLPVLIIGKGEHPEVIAIKANALSYSNKVFVISSLDDLDKISNLLIKEKKAGIVVQTTQTHEFLQSVISKLLLVTNELVIFNTICKSTQLRQQEAKTLAKESDLIIIIGGKNSANTTHLAQITADIAPSIHIETVNELSSYIDIIQKSTHISITAGASTPNSVINDVINKLKSI